MNYTLKKSVGQHFLKDEIICKKIIAALQQENFSQLLEIGPGAGALTKYLLALPNIFFKTVELDGEKVAWLQQHLPAIKEKIIHADFLKIALPFENEFAVIGNFPYNISSQILFKILEWKAQVPLLVGMFQQEVAQRIASKEGNKVYGILSVLVQTFYTVEYLFDVPPTAFTPPPKVISGVIKLRRKKNFPAFAGEEKLFILVKTAFNQRRKMLRNGVKNLFSEEVLKENIFNKRAEQLSVDDFAALTFQMK
jgi:16S rRNA (adenine1518-N6/adenine1519-N6)-dimethyltransferase